MNKPSKSYTILFGLTADPIHKGHEQAIKSSVQFLKLKAYKIKKIQLIPVCQPNLIANKKAPSANFKQRFAMCELVANRLSNDLKCLIVVNPIEKQLSETTGEKNYSLNTIKTLHLSHCLFMVSADHFQGRWPKFRKWYKWQELLQYSGLLINQRPGHRINESFIKQLKSENPDIFCIKSTKAIDISSSKIRKNRNNYFNKGFLSKDIIHYIKNEKLYI